MILSTIEHDIVSFLENAPKEGFLESQVIKKLCLSRDDIKSALTVLEDHQLTKREPMMLRWQLTENGLSYLAEFRQMLTEAMITDGDSSEVAESSITDVVVNWPYKPATTDVPEFQQPKRQIDSEYKSLLDNHQLEVVMADWNTTQLVDAPPGCGKTFTACALAASLTKKLYPNEILVLSFTRVAVKEMRDRIKGFVLESGVAIHTIDQFAFHMTREMSGNFEDGIKRALKELSSGDASVEAYRHVIVDEAQDLVGVRAQFVAEVLTQVSEAGGGYTVFQDPAQAIYDWQEDEDSEDSDETQRLADLIDPQHTIGLKTLYRTDDPDLEALFSETREIVLEENDNAYSMIQQELREWDSYLNPDGLEDLLRYNDTPTFVVFRSRVEVVLASSFLREAGVHHGVRFGGAPHFITPWIAAVINTAGQSRLGWRDFYCAWKGVTNSTLLDNWTVDEAWHALAQHRTNRDKEVDVEQVSRTISRGVPPASFAKRSAGEQRSGLTLGTIHGLKGREAERVIFALPKSTKSSNPAAEAKVLFVALSRAKSELIITTGYNLSQKGKKKCYRPYRQPGKGRKENRRKSIYVGMKGDIDPLLDLGILDSEPDAQSLLATFESPIKIACERPGNGDWMYRLLWNEVPVGQLTNQLNSDMFHIQGNSKGLPKYVPHIRIIDVVSASATDGVLQGKNLREPYKTTKIWLKPIVSSFSTLTLGK